MDNSKNIVLQSLNKNPAGVEKAFNSAIGTAIINSIEAKKAEVGANMLMPKAEETD